MTLLTLQAECFSFLVFQRCYLIIAGCRGYLQFRNLPSPWHLSTPLLVQIHSASDVLKLDMELLHFNISALPHEKPFHFPTPCTILENSIPFWDGAWIQLYSALSNRWGDWPCGHTNPPTHIIIRSVLWLGWLTLVVPLGSAELHLLEQDSSLWGEGTDSLISGFLPLAVPCRLSLLQVSLCICAAISFLKPKWWCSFSFTSQFVSDIVGQSFSNVLIGMWSWHFLETNSGTTSSIFSV